ncbi:ThiF family adenylyltransferase [Vibrio metoecus]|nr:hypothetical protein [Vibrio cholerae]
MENLHQVLLSIGFQYAQAKKFPKETRFYNSSNKKGYYTKKYRVGESGHSYSVALILPQDPHIELPYAYTYEVPDELKGKLIPHISHEGYVCYVEQMEADWNPNELITLYKAIDLQIQKTLEIASVSFIDKKKGNQELANEFVSYWAAERSLYLMSDCSRKFQYKTYAAHSLDDPCKTEFITVGNSTSQQDITLENDEIVSWLKQRRLTLTCDSVAGMPTFYVRVKPNQLSGITWPPESFKEVLLWLQKVDISARNHLVYVLSSSSSKRNLVLLDIEGQYPISIYLELNTNLRTDRLGKNSRKKGSASSVKHIALTMGSRHFCSNFTRVSVVKADRKTLQSRNKKRPQDLSKYRIALIGCGTIGGYLAHLLLRSGAGCGTSPFHLYDADTYNPQNFSRHPLTARSFGANKAEELAHDLKSSIHISKNIVGHNKNFLITEVNLRAYDIVIDATGRPPVSKRLAFVVRSIDVARPTLIHAFNDGNGRASKVMIDKGSSCYNCMRMDKSVHFDGVDSRFSDIDLVKERHISCGNTYTSFDSAVSHVTAAIAQEAVLNSLESSPPWTYSEFVLDERFRTGKRRVLIKQNGCSICDKK